MNLFWFNMSSLSHLDLLLAVSLPTIAILFIVIVTCLRCTRSQSKKKISPRRTRRQRTRTQVQTLMLVTRELHKYYKECEELGIEIDEQQRKSHLRLQQRLSDRKSNRDAVTEHKAVVAALQAHADGTNPRIKNVGDALAHDMDWRTAVKNKTSLLDLASPTFDLEPIDEQQDLAIDQIRAAGTFGSAIDTTASLPVRRTCSLKIMQVLHGDRNGCVVGGNSSTGKENGGQSINK